MTLKNEIIKGIIKPKFKENGFKISGNHYRKDENGFVKVFNPQFSMFNDSENIKLTFNLGIYFPETTRFENNEQPKKLSYHECQFSERYGKLCTNSGNDYWVEKNSTISVSDFQNEIHNCIVKSISWFNQFKTVQSLQTLSNHKFAWNAFKINYNIAVFELLTSPEKALARLEKEIKESANEELRWVIHLKNTCIKIKQDYM